MLAQCIVGIGDADMHTLVKTSLEMCGPVASSATGAGEIAEELAWN